MENEQWVKHELFDYTIHFKERYVEVYFYGRMTEGSVFLYLKTVWSSHPELFGFSELIDLTQVERVDMNTGELANIVQIGRALDDNNQRSKIALVVIDSYHFFKGELYQTLQQLYPAKNKEIEVFKDRALARQWITQEQAMKREAMRQ